jgi:ribose transport system substrate-binding protein
VRADAPWKSNAYTGKFIDSGTVFVGADKADNYEDAMKGITSELMGSFKATYLSC